MYGNFPAAAAIVHRASLLERASPGILAILGTCCPKLIGECLNKTGEIKKVYSYLAQLNAFLRGYRISREVLSNALAGCFTACADAFEQALLFSGRLALLQVVRLGTWPALAAAHLNKSNIARIVSDGLVTLLPPQFRAIRAGLLTSESNGFISLPTSAGKTLLGELCMIEALADEGIACFVAPYIAVGRQVTLALRRHASDDITVCDLFGAFGMDSPTESLNAPRVAIVATPERFDGLMRQGVAFAARLRCVVIDEAHLVGNDQRGVRIEGLIARLRLLQNQGYNFRVIALSAVIAKPDAFCDWLGVPLDSRYIDPWRPTARRLGLWRQNGVLQWYRSDDIVRPMGTRRTSPLGQRTVPWPALQPYPIGQPGGVKKARPRVYSNVAYLCELLNRDVGSPTLCICGSRAATRVLAAVVADRRDPLPELPPKLAELIGLIENNYDYLTPLAEMARRGVAYHNSALPQRIRYLIEDSVKERSMSVVAATTTLAEGVDLPFRNTVIADWLLYRSGKEQPMPPLLFRNIAGRCGRAGIFTEGDTIIFDNVLGDLNHTAPQVRDASRDSLLAEPAPLRSLLAEELHEADDAAQASLAAQFMAAIGENSANENLAMDFANNLYSAFTGEGATVRDRVARVEHFLVAEDRSYVFARAASAIRLTEIGRAVNQSGFAPTSALTILNALGKLDPSWNTIELVTHLLRSLSGLPEQQNETWKRKITNNRTKLSVGLDDLGMVVEGWLLGMRCTEIFAGLPAVRRSSRSPKVDIWLREGLSEADNWSDEYDKFLDFVSSVLERFLPWLLHGCALLTPYTGGPAVEIDWDGTRSAIAARIVASEIGDGRPDPSQ